MVAIQALGRVRAAIPEYLLPVAIERDVVGLENDRPRLVSHQHGILGDRKRRCSRRGRQHDGAEKANDEPMMGRVIPHR
jgi:hypothetical protein